MYYIVAGQVSNDLIFLDYHDKTSYLEYYDQFMEIDIPMPIYTKLAFNQPLLF